MNQHQKNTPCTCYLAKIKIPVSYVLSTQTSYMSRTVSRPLSKEEIVRNALARIGRIGYNLLFENCEHFASWCRYGLSKSEQVDNLLTAAAVTTALVATGAIAYGLSRGSKNSEAEKQ